jgi:hypothetical protein
MDNDKYGLHTIDYTIQGWDAIMAADMEIINAMIPTRIIGTLGETVVAYEALYLEAVDSKWYKAQADGILQPCHGLAIEGGDDTDEIRIHRMGEVINAGWAWTAGPIYLDPTTPGALTQTPPGSNVQLIGYALSATKMLVAIEVVGVGGPFTLTPGEIEALDEKAIPVGADLVLIEDSEDANAKKKVQISNLPGGGAEIISRGGAVLTPTVAINIITWRAPFACTVTNVRGYRVGGTGATINARRNGADNHLASALSLTSADTWMDGGAVQNTAYVAGDKLEIMIVTVGGTPAQIAVQVDFTA